MTHYPPNEPSKPLLRKQARALRHSLNMPALSAILCRQVAQTPFFQAARQVALYHPLPGEVDLLALIAIAPEKRWFLPRALSTGAMAFYPYHATMPLEPGAYGVWEPPVATHEPFQPGNTDLLITPGLCFDRAGYRLGYGKGYYDRFISALRPRCLLLGVVPEALIWEALPIDPWDVPVDCLVTENDWQAIEKRC